MPYDAIAQISSTSPLSWGRYIREKPGLGKGQEFEEMIWRDKFWQTEQGEIFIPPMAFKKSLDTAAKRLNLKIPGAGQSKYSKRFESGVIVAEPILLGISRDDLDHEWHNVPADGKPGGSSKVEKCFPVIAEWEAEVKFIVLDDIIKEKIFRQVLHHAGQFVGVGRWRPEKAGYNGRFRLEKMTWSEVELFAA
jgi:hypothetical protein